MTNMLPGPLARAELGKPGGPISDTLFWALKKAMGVTGRRVDVEAMRRWWRRNPNFRIMDVRDVAAVEREACPVCGRLVGVLPSVTGKRTLRKHRCHPAQ